MYKRNGRFEHDDVEDDIDKIISDKNHNVEYSNEYFDFPDYWYEYADNDKNVDDYLDKIN